MFNIVFVIVNPDEYIGFFTMWELRGALAWPDLWIYCLN